MSLEITFGCREEDKGHWEPTLWEEQNPAVSWARPKLSCFLIDWNYWTFLFYYEIHCYLFVFVSRTKPGAFYMRNRSLLLCARETIVVAWVFNLVCYCFWSFVLFTNEPNLRSKCLLLGCLFLLFSVLWNSTSCLGTQNWLGSNSQSSLSWPPKQRHALPPPPSLINVVLLTYNSFAL